MCQIIGKVKINSDMRLEFYCCSSTCKLGGICILWPHSNTFLKLLHKGRIYNRLIVKHGLSFPQHPVKFMKCPFHVKKGSMTFIIEYKRVSVGTFHIIIAWEGPLFLVQHDLRPSGQCGWSTWRSAVRNMKCVQSTLRFLSVLMMPVFDQGGLRLTSVDRMINLVSCRQTALCRKQNNNHLPVSSSLKFNIHIIWTEEWQNKDLSKNTHNVITAPSVRRLRASCWQD